MTAPILIVGGGLAGLFCALKLARAPSPCSPPRPSARARRRAGRRAASPRRWREGDSPEKHTADTVPPGPASSTKRSCSAWRARRATACATCCGYGVPFDKDLEGHLVQSREAAHSERRIVRVRGDMAGKAIMEALIAAVRRTPSITVLEG